MKDRNITCGHCGRTWNDEDTPTPAARCPYEYEHEYEEETEMNEHLANFKYYNELLDSLINQGDYEEETYKEYFELAENSAWEYAVSVLNEMKGN